MPPDNERGRPGEKAPPTVSTATAPTVSELVAHLEQVQHRVVQDAVAEATSSYWLRRASAFKVALPRQDEWHGREGLASVRTRRDRLKAIITACEHAADIAMWQDGRPQPDPYADAYEAAHDMPMCPEGCGSRGCWREAVGLAVPGVECRPPAGETP